MISLLEKLKGKRVAVLTHRHADIDALISAYLINNRVGGEIVIYEGMDHASQELASEYNIDYRIVEKGEEKYIDNFDYLIVVDTHSIEQLRLMEGREAFVVIDHHERSASLIKSKYYFINKEAVSNTQNILWLLGIENFNKEEKELIAISMISDTFRFKRFDSKSANEFSQLLKSIDKSYDELLKRAFPKMKMENKLIIFNAIKKTGYEIVEDFMLCYTTTEEHTGEIATMLSFFCDLAIVFKKMEDSTSMSLRCNEFFPLPLNALAERIAKRIGGAGGGHKRAAGAFINKRVEKTREDVLRALKEEITKMLKEGFKD